MGSHIKKFVLIISNLSPFLRIEESELDDLSCTDIEQQWGLLKASTLKKYEAKRLVELCHVKSQKDAHISTLPEVTKEMEQRWRDVLTSCKRTA